MLPRFHQLNLNFEVAMSSVKEDEAVESPKKAKSCPAWHCPVWKEK